ncbi:hypothetical protein DBV15_10006, partial [Temnothorax longispinosus]
VSTVILEIVRVGALQRNDVRPAYTCARRTRADALALVVTARNRVQTRARTHARTHARTRNVQSAVSTRSHETYVALRNNSCHGERYRQHTRATPDFNGAPPRKREQRERARPLDLAREKRELLLHFSERFTTTLCRASFVRRPFRVAAWEFKMKATSRRHNLADDDELC